VVQDVVDFIADQVVFARPIVEPAPIA